MRVRVREWKTIELQDGDQERVAWRVETDLNADERAQITDAINAGKIVPIDIGNNPVGNVWYGGMDGFADAGLVHLEEEYNRQTRA